MRSVRKRFWIVWEIQFKSLTVYESVTSPIENCLLPGNKKVKSVAMLESDIISKQGLVQVGLNTISMATIHVNQG